MESLLQDLRYAVRVLRRNAGSTAIIVLTLAVGIGASTAIFTLVNAVLLQSLPYQEPDELVHLLERADGFGNMSVAYLNFVDWRERSETVAAMAAYNWHVLNLTGGETPERVIGVRVTEGAFELLGIAPLIGRGFTPEEHVEGSERVAILSHAAWSDRYGADPAVLGSKVVLDEQPVTVIGVMPPAFAFPPDSSPGAADIWIPGEQWADGFITERGSHPGIQAIGRLAEGASLEAAAADLDAIAVALEEQYPESNSGNRVRVTALHARIVRNARPVLLVLFGAVGFVLLIGCANVANLLLVRSTGRTQEVAVRTALGARRGRIVRLVLTESLIMAIAGGALGVLLALGAIELLAGAVESYLPRAEAISVDTAVLAFAVATSLLTGVLFGLAPAIQVSATNVQNVLKEGGRGPVAPGQNRLRSLLVVTEVALALTLLVGAGLMMGSVGALLSADTGLVTERVASVQIALPDPRYAEDEPQRRFGLALIDELAALPDVESAALVTPLPLSQNGWQTSYYVEGTPEPGPGEMPSTEIMRVTPAFHTTMGIDLVRGRFFSETDDAEGAPVVIVDESFVERYWPDEDPIGKRFKLGRPEDDDPWLEVVGVVRQVALYGASRATFVQTYLPFAQEPVGFITAVVKHRPGARELASQMRQAVQRIDPAQPVYNFRTLDSYLSATTDYERLSAALLGFFSFLAIGLAGLGIAGLIAYAVSQRRHELGVRMALGASPRDAVALVLRQGLGLVLAGLAVGLVTSYALSTVLESQLYEISPTDPSTFGAVAVGTLVAGAAACLIPARRVTRVDPASALRID